MSRLLNLIVLIIFRIPLIQRRTGSPDANAKSKLDKAKGAKTVKDADESTAAADVDERLLTEVHTVAVAAVDKLVSCFCDY